MTTTHPRARFAALLILPLFAACGGMGGMESPSPEESIREAVGTITAEDVARHIGVLAHDSMRGRDTPSPELEQAATYLAQRFEAMGLEPAGENGTYIDRFEWNVSRLAESGTTVSVQDGDFSLEYGLDFFLVPGSMPVSAEGVYVGVAGEARATSEHRGKLVFMEHPGTELNQQWQQTMMSALQPAMMSGAAGLVMILDPAFPAGAIGAIAQQTGAQQAPFPIIGMSHAAADRLMNAAGTDLGMLRGAGPTPVENATFEVRWERAQETHTPPNVAAMLPGSDPELRDTYVVMTAHFDHVGVGGPNEDGDSIYNGADDNASGTVGLLEVAEAFAALRQAPARSVVFVAVSAEEKGLLGAMAYVEDPPVIDIENVVANVNMDMIGRNAPDTVVGIGQEYSTLEDVLNEIQEHHPELGLSVILDPLPEENYFFRSDQLAFIQQGIPAVFFTTSDHEDYHQPSDEADKINNDKVARVARMAFLLAYHVANDPVAPEWTEEGRRQIEQMLQQSPF